MARVGCVLGRVAGVLSAEMGKATKGKAGAKAGETWYSKQCRDNPNFKAESVRMQRRRHERRYLLRLSAFRPGDRSWMVRWSSPSSIEPSMAPDGGA